MVPAKYTLSSFRVLIKKQLTIKVLFKNRLNAVSAITDV
jgi:hypothetical protein